MIQLQTSLEILKKTTIMKAFSQKKQEWQQYHLVKKEDLKKTSHHQGSLCAKEVVLRTKYTNKYYHREFDAGHKAWVKKLSEHVTLTNKLNMSLDDLIMFRKGTVMAK